MLRRYLLFAGPHFYPGGGWADFCGSFDTLAEAKAHLRRGDLRRAGATESFQFDRTRHWFQVVDRQTGAFYNESGWHQAEVQSA